MEGSERVCRGGLSNLVAGRARVNKRPSAVMAASATSDAFRWLFRPRLSRCGLKFSSRQPPSYRYPRPGTFLGSAEANAITASLLLSLAIPTFVAAHETRLLTHAG